MLDFLIIDKKTDKKTGNIVYKPKYNVVSEIEDIIMNGGKFYAIWDSDNSKWVTSEIKAQNMIDKLVAAAMKEDMKNDPEQHYIRVQDRIAEGGAAYEDWYKLVNKRLVGLNDGITLDRKLIFKGQTIKKEDYCTRTLNWAPEEGVPEAFNELFSVLYDEENFNKLKWGIGCIISGDSMKKSHKMMALVGPAGSGKSTFLKVLQGMFPTPYTKGFQSKDLVLGKAFSTGVFKDNPLIAIDDEGDLSTVRDNTLLNRITAHDDVLIDIKHVNAYSLKLSTMLWIASNSPVMVTDKEAGMNRRLIDVVPTNKTVDIDRYEELMAQIEYEYPHIAYECLQFYKQNKDIYKNYVPTSQMKRTNLIHNFMIEHADEFVQQGDITLSCMYDEYKKFCEAWGVTKYESKMKFRDSAMPYFDIFLDRTSGGNWAPCATFRGFKIEELTGKKDTTIKSLGKKWLDLKNDIPSQFDIMCKDLPAQLAKEDGVPSKAWRYVKTTLADISTSELHYVNLPIEHIVIDFDLKDENGEKDLKANLAAAKKFPKTYAEVSKSGGGLHLHYIYTGDPEELDPIYDDGIEVKVYKGGSSLRRKLTKCNDIPIATISTGLPLKKKEVKVFDKDIAQTEKGLKTTIEKALRKEVHADTHSNVLFIKKIVDEAYNSGVTYDISDYRQRLVGFAASSTNHAEECLKIVSQLHYQSQDIVDGKIKEEQDAIKNKPIAFFDVEIFPNLFIFVYKEADKDPVKMINPTPDEVENVVNTYNLIGYNNMAYDNDIVYAAIQGYSNEELYRLSHKLVSKSEKVNNFNARGVGYADIFQILNSKKSLKVYEVEYGINHVENSYPWDEPLDESHWEEVADYCVNDVISTQEVFDRNQGAWTARLILSDLSGLPVRESTNSHTCAIIFGLDSRGKINKPINTWYDLSKDFPGYEFIQAAESEDGKAHNMYRGEDVGLGGYVYAEPGYYENVITFDVASMHPHSIIAMRVFNEHTDTFEDIVNARIAIKHKDYEKAGQMFGGKLKKYLTDDKQAKDLSNALKVAINSVYGITYSKYATAATIPNNYNNIVALRGALFMVNLKHEVQKRGFKVAHIKTDSIKIVNPDNDIFNFVMDYGQKYGYTFEIEHKFEKICLVNNSTYIAKLAADDPDDPGKWTATAAEFQHPFVFKPLFSKEDVTYEDYTQIFNVTGSAKIVMDFNEGLSEGEHNYIPLGKVDKFVPVVPGKGGAILYREDPTKTNKDGDIMRSAVANTDGFRWKLASVVSENDIFDELDFNFYDKFCQTAIDDINKYVDFDEFVK